MTTLTEFLLARIAEDEAVARDFGTDAPGAIPDSELWVTEADYPAISITAKRVLAECDAQRQMIAYLADLAEFASDDEAADAGLRILALPYADHPDYDPAWRP